MFHPALASLLPLLLAACGGEEKPGQGEETQPTSLDADADGYPAGEDCNDSNPALNPGAAEICDNVDNNCDGAVDEGATTAFYLDADGDGYGGESGAIEACALPAGYAAEAGDCDDTDFQYYPGAPEDDCADPEDYNCDGSVAFADADGDGAAACEDCDDGDAAVKPGADEVCDGADNDCDGDVDVDDPSVVGAAVWFPDEDGDDYGDEDGAQLACEAPAGYADNHDDCDDDDAAANPGAAEICDGADNDCDGDADEDGAAGAQTFYEDDDGDGYGDAAGGLVSCDQPSGYVGNDDDCDDLNAAAHPGEAEVCDNDDNDCDGTVDEPDALDAAVWYPDGDKDGYGDGSAGVESCDRPAGYVTNGTDCDDAASSIKPAATDTPYDGIDQDCSGADVTDVDGDGYDAMDVAGDDCDDADAGANPGEPEVCDGSDNDCDGESDENSAIDAETWYYDGDSDGYGDPDVDTVSCEPPEGYIAISQDCDDSEATIRPSGTEEPYDGIDQDCSGADLTDVDGDGHDALDASGDDCDDADAGASPSEPEVCDGSDNDCDGESDESSALDAETWHYDGDSDGYGDDAVSLVACEQPDGHVLPGGDCDDADDALNPDMDEYCADGLDNDCDGATDDETAVDAAAWHPDADEDGFGSEDEELIACDQPDGYVADGSDCDDADAAVFEGCAGSFDGTTGTAWETLASSLNATYSLITYRSADIPYIYNMYYTQGQYYNISTNTWAYMFAYAFYSAPWTSMAPWDGDLWMIRNNMVYSYDPGFEVWMTEATISGGDDSNMTESDEYGVIYGHTSSGQIVAYDATTGAITYYTTGKGSQYETRMAYDPIGRAIFFGAYNAPNLYRFDLTTKAVTTMASHPESQLNDIFCGDRSGHIYAAGGTSGTTMYQYTIATNTWKAIVSLPSEHGNNGSCTVSEDGWLYVGTGSYYTFYRLALY